MSYYHCGNAQRHGDCNGYRGPLDTYTCLCSCHFREPCVCDTDQSCLADEHDKGRCDACGRAGIYPLCCADHQARMCTSCANANHGGEP